MCTSRLEEECLKDLERNVSELAVFLALSDSNYYYDLGMMRIVRCNWLIVPIISDFIWFLSL